MDKQARASIGYTKEYILDAIIRISKLIPDTAVVELKCVMNGEMTFRHSMTGQ